MNPETAHKVTLWGLRLAEKMRVLPLVMGEVPSDPVEILGMKFPNRVGLAAGMDKEADTVSAFGQAGFGFVEVGTLTPRPQPGNEKPRLFRLIPQKAIINRMGFNNEGIAAGVENIRSATRFHGVLGVNIGKNKITQKHIQKKRNEYHAHTANCCHRQFSAKIFFPIRPHQNNRYTTVLFIRNIRGRTCKHD